MTKRDDWKTLPLPKEHAEMDFERTFSETEFQKIVQGILPEQMEDKWFIFFENNHIYFHRSWTGFCLFVLELDSQRRVVKTLVNRNPEQFKNNNEQEDLRLLNLVINVVLLRFPFPRPEKSL
jgi:CRISPR/Cas system CMR subunit Cmr4 (Cas7 group RAMP superfamily)